MRIVWEISKEFFNASQNNLLMKNKNHLLFSIRKGRKRREEDLKKLNKLSKFQRKKMRSSLEERSYLLKTVVLVEKVTKVMENLKLNKIILLSLILFLKEIQVFFKTSLIPSTNLEMNFSQVVDLISIVEWATIWKMIKIKVFYLTRCSQES